MFVLLYVEVVFPSVSTLRALIQSELFVDETVHEGSQSDFAKLWKKRQEENKNLGHVM